MSINLPPNPTEADRQLDYILITGLLPFLLLGEWIVKQRYAFLDSNYFCMKQDHLFLSYCHCFS